MSNGRDCIHGNLARSCGRCEKDRKSFFLDYALESLDQIGAMTKRGRASVHARATAGFIRTQLETGGEGCRMSDQIKATAWRCTWDSEWVQYHDASDPMPEKWDDAPDFVEALTPLYEANIAIDALRAEVEALTSAASEHRDGRLAALERAAKAEAALAECREDAERYRWIRKQSRGESAWGTWDGTLYRIPDVLDPQGRGLDAAIDAARAK